MKKKYGALRFIVSLVRVIAWIVLVGGIIGALAMVIVAAIGGRASIPGVPATQGAGGVLMALLMGLGIVIGSALGFLFFQAQADLVYLGLAIEENTRLTAQLLQGDASLRGLGE
ncbi:MAG: hypothetical protein ACOX2L_04300 [Anaerolineae bacterium]|jgi:hypothetical protein|nr:hypothetical protein [Chloroflexota bacterium]